MAQQFDLLAELERDVLDPTVSLADVLRECIVLASRIDAPQLREWATAELSGYPGLQVPEYRKVRAPIMEMIESAYGTHTVRPFNVASVPEQIREYFTEIVPLNQGVDTLEALVTGFEAQGRQIDLEHYASGPYTNTVNKGPNRRYRVVALYWTLRAPARSGVTPFCLACE